MPETPHQSSHPATLPLAPVAKGGPDLRSMPGFFQGQLAGAAAEGLSWLWHGYLAAGNVTLHRFGLATGGDAD